LTYKESKRTDEHSFKTQRTNSRLHLRWTEGGEMASLLLSIVAALFLCFSAGAVTKPVHTSTSTSDWPQWRGPERNGISKETGLLKQWPAGGPKLLWQLNDIGDGYSGPSVVGTRLYLMSNRGMDNEFVQALSAQDGPRASVM
jgi:hypothetical protein